VKRFIVSKKRTIASPTRYWRNSTSAPAKARAAASKKRGRVISGNGGIKNYVLKDWSHIGAWARSRSFKADHLIRRRATNFGALVSSAPAGL